jgi:hypothetical protein
LANNLPRLNASRFDWQFKNLAYVSINQRTPVGHAFGKIGGVLDHVQLHIESQRLDWGWSIKILGNGGDIPDIHRRERLTEEILRAGKRTVLGAASQSA